GADLSLADVPGIGTLERTAAQPARGNQREVRAAQTGGAELGSAAELPNTVLSDPLGGLSDLNLLDLVVDLELDVDGGDAIGGSATGGDALLQATIDGSLAATSGSTVVQQTANEIYGGDATGGRAIGGDGIDLDLVLDADIDLVVDADVDLAADVDTFIEADLSAGSQRQGAQLARFESND
ncbi:MAG: hypothetical protein M3509_10120, partial [Chloroflexota bacterium]|nr:hypothetical protein [Chloroflexota bacterium]